MIELCRSQERLRVRSGKQDTWHTFSPDQPGPRSGGFGCLVGLDELRLPPAARTARRRGNDAELVTYAYHGALSQEDSAGHSGVIHAGEFQCMSAGDSIVHRETNVSRSEWARLFQMFLRPSQVGLARTLEQSRFTAAQRRNTLCVVASPDGRKGSLRIHQDVLVYSSILDRGHHLAHRLLSGRSAWLHIVAGEATLDGIVLAEGDGVGVSGDPSVSLTGQEETEILLIDLGPPDEPGSTIPDLVLRPRRGD